MEKKVLEKGLLEESQQKAESTIKTFIQSSYPDKEYTFAFHIIEEE